MTLLSEGDYWVRDHRDNKWRIARWNPVMNWWVLAWVSADDPAYPSGVCSSARFKEIGPEITPPN